ncbi:MAG: molybdenum cofactor guanylyltransferase [Novosphingobium sp.]|nr:molybdenum cofactor guanylyltransferase [Novosphingobium sp.]
MILGAVLAGGQSRRFGSDKALAMLGGHTLIARAVDTLSAWCAQVVVVGRRTAPAPTLPDWPKSGMGPLAGIAAALHHACDKGYAAVLSCGVDSLDLPEDLPHLFDPAPAYLADQPVIGLWPCSATQTLEAILTAPGRHSMLRFAEAIGARAVKTASQAANINTPADLAAAEKRHELRAASRFRHA